MHRSEKWNVGILLLKRETTGSVGSDAGDLWCRLGLVIWDLMNNALSGRTTKEKEILLGESETWIEIEGLFG